MVYPTTPPRALSPIIVHIIGNSFYFVRDNGMFRGKLRVNQMNNNGVAVFSD